MATTLYLIPLPLSPNKLEALPAQVWKVTEIIKHFFVEDVRTCRRFIKELHPALNVEPILFQEVNQHTSPDRKVFKEWVKAGVDIGVMSEAGCPGIADPGAEVVSWAHELSLKVVPLTGPSSITLALMASGLSGQNFAFNGYLPVKEPERSKRIKELEQHSAKNQQTQSFIETPYRNNNLLADLLKNCSANTLIAIAQDVTGDKEWIKTKTVAEWKKQIPKLEKLPTVFSLLAG